MFGNLCNRHPLAVHAMIFLLKDPYLPQMQGKERFFQGIATGSEGAIQLDRLLYDQFLGDDDEGI